ncbi:unnamed protein product [Angiostrongylus costaricensis]|uniref:Uncharacterized protein n=1 Tax=Angiostrongylus costaricensis TaxID=334426 RepID=A0A0R3PYK8_ANGCS|nr:unnamed protein product [Angiostrongylus costaricensis]
MGLSGSESDEEDDCERQAVGDAAAVVSPLLAGSAPFTTDTKQDLAVAGRANGAAITASKDSRLSKLCHPHHRRYLGQLPIHLNSLWLTQLFK